MKKPLLGGGGFDSHLGHQDLPRWGAEGSIMTYQEDRARALARRHALYLRYMKPEWQENLKWSLLRDTTWKPPIEVMYGSNGFQLTVTYTRVMVPDTWWLEADTCHYVLNGISLHPDHEGH